jgi:SOS-response transcriptional repressor LexA
VLVAIARRLSVPAESLQTGRPTLIDVIREHSTGGAAANTTPGPDISGEVPLISWVRAGAWDDASDEFQPGDAEDWLPFPRRNGAHRVYALRVRGVFHDLYNRKILPRRLHHFC